jgi:hypothetical protein
LCDIFPCSECEEFEEARIQREKKKEMKKQMVRVVSIAVLEVTNASVFIKHIPEKNVVVWKQNNRFE